MARRQVLILISLTLIASSSLTALLSISLANDSSSDENTSRILAGAAPVIWAAPPEPSPAIAGEPSDYSFIIQDTDSGFLNLTWDWGDGIVETTNLTFTPGDFLFPVRSHTYNPIPEPGRSNYVVNFVFNFTVTDPDLNSIYDATPVECTVNVVNQVPPPAELVLEVNATFVDPTDIVNIVASAIDPEGDPLTWTFRFVNESGQTYRISVLHTPVSAPGQRMWSNLTHTFGTVGRHMVYMNISDALPPYDVWPHNVSTNIDVDVAINLPPGVGSGVINTDPTSLIINSTLGYGLMTYSTQATDLDGDIITVTWNFGDGTPEVVNVSAGGTATYTFVQVRNYTDAGIFNITVNITDGRPGHEVSIYKVVTIQSTNLPPVLLVASQQYYGNLSYARPDQVVNFTLVIQDPEQDAVEVMIDFGDGSPKMFANLTEFVEGNATLLFNHTYKKVGNYTVLINYTDNKIGKFEHNKNVTMNVVIYVPAEAEVVIWNAWDYISLALFCMIPVVIAVRMVMINRRRKQLEQEGVSLEEWKLITSELGSQEKK